VAFTYILSILIWIIAITLILPEIGIEFSALIASAGIIVCFLSFGTGNLIKDYFSGMIILFEDQFDIGDEIELRILRKSS
jgi:small conductance mechanosensitive channel